HLFTLRGGPVIDLTIRPAYRELLARLGNPHMKLSPVIHVAGTNGKGSTIAFLRAMLEAAGYKVHVYTSPHLKKFNERIVLAGREIDDAALEALLDEVTAANGDLPLTFFEITTAMAFMAFARIPADVVLLETGMGGRLDSTNVVARPVATVITPIGMDHREFLGNSVAAIAGEKAGILKRGVPCITAPQQDPQAESVILHRAKELSVPIQRFGHEWQIGSNGSAMAFRYADDSIDLPMPRLTGPHQVGNAGTALAALMTLRDLFIVPRDALAAGLESVQWPGRLQRITDYPGLPPGWELWADGAHNENAAQALAAQMALWRAQDGKNLHIIVGMMRRKDVAGFLAPLIPYAASVTGIPIGDDPLAHDRESFMAALAPAGMRADWADSITMALRMQNGPPARTLVTGSLYLMKEVL
ncbi:MAG TPA: folylpolyglutamate synthase/dihydrofolate synthase family protein, partial [Alphaproteobacteria bacterium]